MANRKVLIITYYWPPSGGSGVQRWLKFTKYLCKKGWEPIVFTPENPSFTIKDESLLSDIPSSVEVIRFPIWEPYQIFFGLQRLFGKKELGQSDFISTGKKSFFQKVSSWIRGNFFIPDARVFWVKPATKMIGDLIKSNQIEKVITTGPPHSIHLIGLKLKIKHPDIKWIADFRDPWSEWDLLDTLSLTSWARARHRNLEHKVLTTADRVITIAPYHVERLKELGKRHVELITNGFDAEDFSNLNHVSNEKFTIRHVGVVDELRDPRPIMDSIKTICMEEPALKDKISVEFIGAVNTNFKSYVNEDDVLSKITCFTNQIPHDELIQIYGKTDLQLLVLAHSAIAPGNLPGKFFEYLASGNPILAIGPIGGDAAQVIGETNSGKILDPEDVDGIKEALLEFYESWKSQKVRSVGDSSNFTRQVLTDKLIVLLESLEN